MPTLAELINERRAKIDAFDYDLYDGRADLDISGLRHAMRGRLLTQKPMHSRPSISFVTRLRSGSQI